MRLKSQDIEVEAITNLAYINIYQLITKLITY